MNWPDRKILVTGGTRGIGRAIAMGLLEKSVGGLVVAAEEAAPPPDFAELESLGAGYACADLGTEDEPGKLVEEAAEHLGGLNGLVHCAGVYLESNPGDRDAVQIWNETVNIKARGGYLLAHAFSRIAAEGASFVGVTSINAEQSEPDHLAYDPACAALGGVIRAFAVHFASRLRFNAIAPGLIHTRLTGEVASSPELTAHAGRNIPLGVMGKPQDCVGAALFLLGGDSAYITGETIFVDGGIRANQMSRPD
ncbi:MAG: SDR family oxidoreductase [Verrucomicrobiales bacterium]|nr:SDR family oxidoreductase [Verrucomicrobiales bacterium]